MHLKSCLVRQRAELARITYVLTLVLASLVSSSVSTFAQTGNQVDLNIGGPPHSHVWVTTPEGSTLGSCTIPDTGGAWAPSCSVPVPHPSTVLVYVDESTLPAGSAVEENPIVFNTSNLHGRDSWGGAPIFQVTQGSANSQGTSNIAVVTTENGQPYYDACFVLVDFSNVGCDVNRDGMITFQDIPYGTYTLRQTSDLGGSYVGDTTITVSGAADADGWERFYVSLVGAAVTGSSTGPVDISLITRDPDTGGLITDVCYVLVNYSNEGCDVNEDGQVTFAAIPPGVYEVRQTRVPAGYPAINDFQINVENNDGVSLGFLVRQAPKQNEPATRNLSVVFVDSQTSTRLISNLCVQLVGASNIGCDEDLRDGQVDFLDVPAGTWQLEFNNLPGGWMIESLNTGPGTGITVSSDPDTFSHQIVVVNVNTGGAVSQDLQADSDNSQLIGKWNGNRRSADFYADGTGDIQYSFISMDSYIIFHVEVDVSTTPMRANVYDVTVVGEVDLESYANVGDTLYLRFEQFPGGNVLVVEDERGWDLWLCPSDKAVEAGDACSGW